MPDFDPKDMDALFREGAERHEFEYNPNAWTLMEEKLDKKQNNKRVLFYLLGLILLVGSVAIYSYVNNNSNKEIIVSNTNENKSNESIEINKINNAEVVNEISDVRNNEKRIIANNTNDLNNHKELKNESILTNSKVSNGNIGAQNSFQSENTGNLVGNEIVSIDSQVANTKTIVNFQEERIIPNSSQPTIFSTIEESTIDKRSRRENIFIPYLSNNKIANFNIDQYDLSTYDLQPSNLSVSPIVNPLLTNRFAFTLFANPEWSSVGLFQESKAGWSVGTKIGYQFADKFEISAGLAFSRKIYEGAGKEYTMEGGWFIDIEPMAMDAKCDVIEIPLALTYYVNGFRNSGFFADLGINSYMLHSEWYGFDYNDSLVRPERYLEVTEEDENTHLVGVGRVAIGYQKVLSNHTSVQIAPYLQFPLTGIGAGRVNLYSSGVQIAVKFNTQ